MSRSNNTEIKNPAAKFFQWNGENGGFNYYDKETEKKIDVSLPITFIVLDKLHTVKGFNDKMRKGYYSNEIRDFKKEPLNIRCGKQTFEHGLYAEVMPKCPGAKYTQSVYVLMKEGDIFVLNNLQLTGAAVGPWIDFCSKFDVYKGAVTVKTMVDGKKGKVEYKMPVFSPLAVTPETDAKATEADKTLQEYLKAYFVRQGQEFVAPAEVVEESLPVETSDQALPPSDKDDLPF